MKKFSVCAALIFAIFNFALSMSVSAQQSEQPPQQLQSVGGVSTGEAKVYTSRRTVGITDAKAPKIFEDVTAQTALKIFCCVSGSKEKTISSRRPPARSPFSITTTTGDRTSFY